MQHTIAPWIRWVDEVWRHCSQYDGRRESLTGNSAEGGSSEMAEVMSA
jgi:hypothetical protein